MTRRRRPDPSELKFREARDRYLRRRKADSTESSVSGWYYRLKLFCEWAEAVGIERVGELQRYDLDEYYEVRANDVAPVTLEGEMWTLKMFVRFLEQLGAVEDLAEGVRIPNLDAADRSDDTALATDAALALIEFYRNDEAAYGHRGHAFLELAWFIGARQGGLRALDVRDYHGDEEYVDFRHRPETGTPLKNKYDGERSVAIPTETAEVVTHYIDNNRANIHDDEGRQPLLASMKGRPHENTVRTWSYVATLPCAHGPCPHDRERETCKYTEYVWSSQCPSSRSPHQIRTGSITWQLNRGIPPEVVAQRVNATVGVIKDHYDTASPEQRWRRQREHMERRRNHLGKLNLNTNGGE